MKRNHLIVFITVLIISIACGYWITKTDRYNNYRELQFLESVVKNTLHQNGYAVELNSEYNILGYEIDEEAALEIGSRSRGTPRIANRLLKRVRDFAEYENQKNINYDISKRALDRLEIDELGLDGIDRQMLETVIYNFIERKMQNV